MFAWQTQHLEHFSGRRNTWSTSVSFCVAGAALRAPQSHFAWQVQHQSTSREVRGSPATIEYCGRRLRLPGKRSTGAARGVPPKRSAEVRQRLNSVDASCICLAGATLGAPQCHFAWHVRSTWSTSLSFCVAGAARGPPPERSTEVRQRLNTVDAGCVCVAGATLGAPQCHFAWQTRSTCSTSVSFCVAGAALGAPQCHFAWQARSTWSTSVSFCVAGAARLQRGPRKSGND